MQINSGVDEGSNDQEEGLLFTREKPFHLARIDFVLAVEAMEWTVVRDGTLRQRRSRDLSLVGDVIAPMSLSDTALR